MALKMSTGNSDLRIYEPSFACEYSSYKEGAEHRSRLLAKIHGAYSKAFERLAINSKARRPVAMRILGADGGVGGGFCFGLLDPASNIIANTLIPYQPRDRAAVEVELEDLERRSLDGMVTFFTRFFPYLADCEAERYLLLADADVLVATRIVVVDRRMKRFGSSEPAVEEALRMALRCAALAAQHPDPDRFVGAWLTISSRLDEATSLLAKVRRRSPSSSIRNLEKLLRGPPPELDDRRGDLLLAWQLAMSRRPLPRMIPYQNSSTGLKRVLLDAIHGFYLQALARLPAGYRRRSLLMAGHCYGPLDPVSNIIVNTIWYDAVFPPTMELELGMVMSTKGLLRIETRSMYGLVSFLCTRYHHLNFHRATRCLLEADGSLLLADPNLDAEAAAAAIAILRMQEPTRLHAPWSTETGFHSALGSRVATHGQGPATGVNEAFRAAATAAWHPKADAQANFLTSCKAMLGSALPLLQGGSQLSTEDAQQMSRLFISPDEPPRKKPLIALPPKGYVRAHTTITEKVKTVLNVYASMPNGGPTYEFHSISSVNDQVSGPVYCLESNACPPEQFYRSHVNFLAAPRCNGSHDNAVPVLFFAEISNDDESKAEEQPFCCPVCIPPPCSERVRCLYCDFVGIRIIHPIGNNFHGREKDFENMVCKKDPFDEDFDPALMTQYYTNTAIIGNSSSMAERIGWLEEDRLYENNDDDSDSDYTSDDDEC